MWERLLVGRDVSKVGVMVPLCLCVFSFHCMVSVVTGLRRRALGARSTRALLRERARRLNDQKTMNPPRARAWKLEATNARHDGLA